MLTIFVSAFVLGFVFNATPGPVLAATIRFATRGGFKPALSVQLGSLAGDALWAVLGLAGIGLLLQVEAIRLPLGIAGVLYLLWLAAGAWRDANRPLTDVSEPTGHQQSRAFRAGIGLSITNPQNIAYWAAIGSALGALGVSDPMPAHYAVFFAGFMTSSVIWCFVCAALVDRLFRQANMSLIRLITRSCALAFLVLAALSARQLWTSEIDRSLAPADHEQTR